MFQSLFHPMIPEPETVAELEGISQRSEPVGSGPTLGTLRVNLFKAIEKRKDPKTVIENLKKKTERESKETIQAEKENFGIEIREIRSQLREKIKEHECMCLKAENAELKEKLQIEKTKLVATKVPERKPFAERNSENPVSSMFSIFKKYNNDGELQKVISENNYLKKQLQNLVNQESVFEEQMEQIKAEWKMKVEGLERKLKTAEDENDRRVWEYQNLLKEKEHLRHDYDLALHEREKIREEYIMVRKEADELRNQVDQYELQSQQKAKTISDLSHRVKELDQEVQVLHEKYTKVKEEMFEIELNLRAWQVKRKGRIADTKALVAWHLPEIIILIRKNVFGDLLVEIEHPDSKILIAPEHIQAFGEVEHAKEQFFVHYKVRHNFVEKEIFESPDSKRILKCLKYMMKEANEKVQLERQPKQEKGIFSQIASIFI